MLTNIQCDRAKPDNHPEGKPAPYTLHDEKGLYLLVKESGARCWRMKCKVAGKPVLLTFGQYPEVSLKKARDERDDARNDIRAGKDPRARKQQEKKANKAQAAAQAQGAATQGGEPKAQAQPDTLEGVALDHLARRKGQDPKSRKQDKRRLERYVFRQLPAQGLEDRTYPDINLSLPLGRQKLRMLESVDFLQALRAVEDAGKQRLAYKIKTLLSGVCGHGVRDGKCKHNMIADLRGAVSPGEEKHFASLQEPREIGELLRRCDRYHGQPETTYCLRLQPLVFLRSYTLRHGRWQEVDFERAEWRIPAKRMKKKQPHVIPLSRQALVLLRELHELTGRGELMFPGIKDPNEPLSNGTLNKAIRAMGYKTSEQTTHGFRSIADTHLHEMGYDDGMIKVQMSHMKKDKTDAAYNYALFLADPDRPNRKPRAEMMQGWADYLDTLRNSRKVDNNVLPFAAPAAAA